MFDMLNPDKIWHEHLTELTTLPVSSHFTLGNPKKSFFNIIIIHILRMIYVTWEENK